MQHTRSNIPDTRARIDARRRRKVSRAQATRQGTGAKAARQGTRAKKAPQADDKRRQYKTARRGDTSTRTAPKNATPRRSMRVSLGAPSRVLGQVREQSRLRMRRTQSPSQVRPGPRQVLLHWIASGRLFSLLLFLASLGTLIYLFISPHFNVQRIQVQGNSVLKDNTVAHLSGLSGLPIWFVDSDQAAEHVLQNAYVEDVRVSIALPDQATITLSERHPEIRWAIGGIQYLIDGSGRVLDVASEPPDPGTLVIVDTTSHTPLQPMDHVDLDAMNVARALALRLPNELNFTPQMIGWDIALGVYVKSSSGQTIVFGQSEHLDRKLAFLRHLLEDGTAFTYLDLRPSNPFYRTEG